MIRILKVGLALLLAGSMWYYAEAVLIPSQEKDASLRHTPRGNLSDLYPRWLGARELLLHGRDPYSAAVTREIQVGYYGEALDGTRANLPKDQQGFAYPLYVVFLLAPTIKTPFFVLRVLFRLLLFVLTVATVPLWVQALGLQIGRTTAGIIVVLLLGSFPVVQGLYLDQLTLLVCFLIAAACAAVARGNLIQAGILLALATIKPQISFPVVGWLVLWAMSDWGPRRRFVWGFASTMAALLGGAEWLLPGWSGRWQGAVHAYFDYTGARSLLEVLLGRYAGLLASVGITVIVIITCWLVRREPAGSHAFSVGLLSVLAGGLLIKPTFPLYDGIVILPVILWLWIRGRVICQQSGRARLLYWITTFLFAWQWIGTLTLTAASLFGSPYAAQHLPHLPLFALLGLPVAVFFLLALDTTEVWRGRAYISQPRTEPRGAAGTATASGVGL